MGIAAVIERLATNQRNEKTRPLGDGEALTDVAGNPVSGGGVTPVAVLPPADPANKGIIYYRTTDNTYWVVNTAGIGYDPVGGGATAETYWITEPVLDIVAGLVLVP